MMIILKIFIIFLGTTLISGCSYNILKFPVVSVEEEVTESNVALVKSNAEFEKEIIFIWFIPIGYLKVEDVVKEFLDKYDADLVKNLHVRANWFHLYLGGRMTYKATGDLFKITNKKEALQQAQRKSYLIIEGTDRNEITEISD